MPYPNEHSCRLRPTSDFQKKSFKRITRGEGENKLDIIIARPKGETKSTAQTYRYPVKTWTEARARGHCKRHEGTFEAASKETREIDGSLQDFISAARSAFEAQFPPKKRGDLTEQRYWVRDVFEEYVVIEDEGQLYRVAMTVEDDRVTFAPHDEWVKVRLSYIQEYVVGEFRGEFPEVAIAGGVDLEALKADDEKPFFVTLPVAHLNAVSANGLVYDEGLIGAILEQVRADRPTGIMGHLRMDELDSAYPVPDVYWVGAARTNGTVWAKGYLPPGEARDMIRRLKAVGGKIATSIFGRPERRVPMSEGRWRAEGFRLEQLDLAPYERAALKLGGRFQVTAEMDNDSSTDSEELHMEEDTMDNLLTYEEFIAELTVKDVPEIVREQIVQEWQKDNDRQDRIKELEGQVKDKDALIETLQGKLGEYRTREFEAALDGRIAELVDWQIEGEEPQKKVDTFRRVLRSRILAELGDERGQDKIKEVSDRIWDEMEPLAETLRDALAGPPAIVPPKKGGRRLEIEDTLETRKEARKGFGF